jgi:hypothetical protein
MTQSEQTQPGEDGSQQWAQQLETYLTPSRERRDAYLDRRVVGNLIAAVAGIVQTRSALSLTELGSRITSPEHADAGTQQLKRALAHQGWEARQIELWWLLRTSVRKNGMWQAS